jgi:hypothetical protein
LHLSNEVLILLRGEQHRFFIPINRLTRIILVGVNYQVTMKMWAMVPIDKIIDFGGVVEIVQHPGCVRDILPELSEFRSREFE